MGGSSRPVGVPERFGKYEILRPLASGGMAEVFVARATGIEGFSKMVVLKRILPKLADDPEIVELFLHEARLAATLEHPNVAQVYDVGMVNGSYFFAMEYVHGADLRHLLRASVLQRKTIPLADAVLIARDVCAALHYAHEKHGFDGKPLDLIHRDVSPSNVLVSYDGAVKVCDFGIAKATSQRHETRSSIVRGKFSYMSPEQLRREPLDRRSDIFAIAIVLHELTTQHKLFLGESDYDLMKAVIEQPIPLPRSRRPDCPRELERIIMKGLSRDVRGRYATAQEMQLDLEALAREEKLALSSVSLQALMASLFDARVDEWQRLQREGKDISELIQLEKADAAGTRTTDFDAEVPGALRARRRWRWASFGAALLAVVSLAGGYLADAARAREARGGIEHEAQLLAAGIDAQARELRMRAEAVATLPMLRAAVSTDAATLADLAEHEVVYSPRPGEVLEVDQERAGSFVTLLRTPKGSAAVTPARRNTAELRIDVRGSPSLVVTVDVVPIYNDKGTRGLIALLAPLDLSEARRQIATTWSAAALQLPGGLIPLVGDVAASPRALVVTLPIARQWQLPRIALQAAAPPAMFAWTRLGGVVLTLLALLFAVGARRRRA